jgi:hypothetical protein
VRRKSPVDSQKLRVEEPDDPESGSLSENFRPSTVDSRLVPR